MARIEPLDSEDVPDLEEVFQIKSDTLGFVPNNALTIVRWPELARAYGQLSQAVKTCRHRHITARLPTWFSSWLSILPANTAGTALSRAISKTKLEQVWNSRRAILFTQAERAALRLATASGFSSSQVTDEL